MWWVTRNDSIVVLCHSWISIATDNNKQQMRSTNNKCASQDAVLSLSFSCLPLSVLSLSVLPLSVLAFQSCHSSLAKFKRVYERIFPNISHCHTVTSCSENIHQLTTQFILMMLSCMLMIQYVNTWIYANTICTWHKRHKRHSNESLVITPSGLHLLLARDYHQSGQHTVCGESEGNGIVANWQLSLIAFTIMQMAVGGGWLVDSLVMTQDSWVNETSWVHALR